MDTLSERMCIIGVYPINETKAAVEYAKKLFKFNSGQIIQFEIVCMQSLYLATSCSISLKDALLRIFYNDV